MTEKKKIDPKAPTTKSVDESDDTRTEEERTSQRLNSRINLRTTQRIFT